MVTVTNLLESKERERERGETPDQIFKLTWKVPKGISTGARHTASANSGISRLLFVSHQLEICEFVNAGYNKNPSPPKLSCVEHFDLRHGTTQKEALGLVFDGGVSIEE